jgi:hypothetical protein
MHVGSALLDTARAAGARSIVVVGVGKNVGKTVAMRAIYEAAYARGIATGLSSIGRDGEAVDAGDAQPKPRLFLRPGTAIATARGVLPASPACEMLELSARATAAGPLVYARVRAAAFYEIVGPPTATGVREAIERLHDFTDLVIVDGAIDRVAALAGGDDAIVVSVGAGAVETLDDAIAQATGLVARLTIPAVDPMQPMLRLPGALTASEAGRLMRDGETRQIVVRDPTQVALHGRAASSASARLRIRCERPLRVVAATAASIGRDHAFEPREFAAAVAAATGLPTFDVYAGRRAA